MTAAALLVLIAGCSGGRSGALDDGGIGGGSDGGTDLAVTPPLPDVSSVFTIDTPNVVRRSNIILGKPNRAPKDAMALGNGTLGAAVWAANGLTAQLNRADTFPDRKAIGQLQLPGLAALTEAADFHGEVDLYDATLRESGGGLSASIFVRADAPELVIDVRGANPASAQAVRLGLWNGRKPAAAVAEAIALLAESWRDDSGMGASGLTFGTLGAVTVGARNVTARVVDALTVEVAFTPRADGSFRVVVAAPTWKGGDAPATAAQALGSDATAATIDGAHLDGWHKWWMHVGLLAMSSSDGSAEYFENLRTIYLYLAAAERGDAYPGSQAGLANLFAYLQDAQPWFPAGYWVWNLRMMIAANLSAGAIELNQPVFNLYLSNLANMQAWTASKMVITSGICLPETMRFNGNGYWYGGENDASCDRAASPNYNALTLTSGAEIGLWIWQHYRWTHDRDALMAGYPLMREAARFLLAEATLGSDGRLHTVANAHETQWAVQDPVTDIVAMQALFDAVVAAAGVLDKDPDLVAQLEDARAKLPPLPRTDAATHQQLLAAADDGAGKDVIALSYEPSAMRHNGENLDLEAVWPYGTIGDDGPDTALARRTYASRLFVNGADWSYDALQAARLGLADEVAAALTRSTQKYQTFVNGLGLLFGAANDGTSEPYVEQLGIVAAALDEALAQSYDDLLRIAPAWPAAWSVAGRLSIAGQARLDVQVVNGRVAFAIIEAGADGALRVRNPWPGQAARVVDGTTGETVVAATAANTFSLPSLTGHWYVLVPDGATLPHLTVSGSSPTAARTFGPVHIGL